MARSRNDRKAASRLLEKISCNEKIVVQAQDEIVNQCRAIADMAAARETDEQVLRLGRELRKDVEAQRRQLEFEAAWKERHRAQVIAWEREKITRYLMAQDLMEYERTRLERSKAYESFERRKRAAERELLIQAVRRADEREAAERRMLQEFERRERQQAELFLESQEAGVCARQEGSSCDSCGAELDEAAYRMFNISEPLREGELTISEDCCFCNNGRYFHCYFCRPRCRVPNHPRMQHYNVDYLTGSDGSSSRGTSLGSFIA